jgi:beta-glucoside PTS system EIICBA component
MAKYANMIDSIIDHLGGKNNISVVNHCATRLRLTISNPSKVNLEGLEDISGVMGVVNRGKEIQLIIGTEVGSVYNEFVTHGNFVEGGKKNEQLDDPNELNNQKTKKNILASIVDFISGTFVPILPILVAAGLVSAVLNIAVTFFGLSAKGGTYTVLTAINNAGFYFLPIFLGYSAARKIGINPMMGAYLGTILVHSSIDGAAGLDFLGITIPQVTYNTSVIPVILGVLFMYYVDRGVGRVTPKEIKFFAQPLITILIVTPVTLLLLGPIGNFIGGYIASALNFVNAELGWLSVGLIGALTPLLVMTGTNQALFPLVFTAMADNGYDAFVMPGMLAANVAVGAAALAVYFRVKKKDTKALALSSGITGVMGITEPAIFGVLLRFKRPLIGAIAGGGVGGLLAGIFQLKQYAVVSPGIAAIPTFIPTDGSGLTSNFWLSIVVIVVSIIVAFAVTYLLGVKDTLHPEQAVTPSDEPVSNNEVQSKTNIENIHSPLNGKLVSLTDVPDPVFSQKMMGDGFAIIPTDGKVVAPVKGEVIQLFESKHAIGIKSEQGLEILIHIGLNTVELNGEGFETLVEVGQTVNAGDTLIKVDLELLKEKSYDVITPVIITNMDKVNKLDSHVKNQVKNGELVLDCYVK